MWLLMPGELGGFGGAPGQVADAAALAGWSSDLGEFPGPLEMAFGFILLAAGVQGGGQVPVQARLRAGEAVVHGGRSYRPDRAAHPNGAGPGPHRAVILSS